MTSDRCKTDWGWHQGVEVLHTVCCNTEETNHIVREDRVLVLVYSITS